MKKINEPDTNFPEEILFALGIQAYDYCMGNWHYLKGFAMFQKSYLLKNAVYCLALEIRIV